MHSQKFAMGRSNNGVGQVYLEASGKSCHKVISMPTEVAIERNCVTGRLVYYVLSSVLAFGILMLVLIPIGSTFLYIDYKQQLAQRKSNKNDLCKSKCSFGAECIVDEYTNQPFCRCPLTCSDDYEPVCGSDRSTHLNLCHLRYESCTKQQPISVLSSGSCDANLCDNVTCHRLEKCQVDERGSTHCVCANTSCGSQEQQPVCGSHYKGNAYNIKMYSSLCAMQKYACLHKLDIVSISMETCLEQGAQGKQLEDGNHRLKEESASMCGSQVCAHYAECKIGPGNQSTCGCPEQCAPAAMANEASSVCGTNQQNYASECEMRRDACLRQLDIKVLHRGQCGECSEKCDFYAQCKSNEFGVPQCVCPQVCLREDRPVCGDNGVTYENECELQVASCRLQRQISVRLNGSCDLCYNVLCPYGATCLNGECVCENNCENMVIEPLCANDGSTYRNECEMRRMACASSKELIALFYGECEESSDRLLPESPIQINELENEPSGLASLSLAQSECHHSQHSCQADKADLDHVFICGNRLFSSRCEMIEFKCRTENNSHKCAKYCKCNRHGIKVHSTESCNPRSGQCDCKESLTGLRCDKCSHKFWNLQLSAENPNLSGCKPCRCNRLGSLSEDCDKLTGKCRCRAGVRGPKCDQCPAGWHLTTEGCVANVRATGGASQCHQLKCLYGGVCRQEMTHAHCSCQFNCPTSASEQRSSPVCASDGSLHESVCHFREHMCRLQKRLHIVKNSQKCAENT